MKSVKSTKKYITWAKTSATAEILGDVDFLVKDLRPLNGFVLTINSQDNAYITRKFHDSLWNKRDVINEVFIDNAKKALRITVIFKQSNALTYRQRNFVQFLLKSLKSICRET